jgi:hypothetical protein
MQETDPELIAEIGQHGPDEDDQLDEELMEGEVAIDVGSPTAEDLEEEQDLHDDGVDERIDEVFSETGGGEIDNGEVTP